MNYVYYMAAFTLLISLLNYIMLAKILKTMRELKRLTPNIQNATNETKLKEAIKHIRTQEKPEEEKVRPLKPKDVIEDMLKKLEEEGINHIEVDVKTQVSYDESRKYLKMWTSKEITREQYERLKDGLERRYYFGYDEKSVMFEAFLKSKDTNRNINKYSMSGIKIYQGFISDAFFLNKEKIEKEFENEPKTQGDLLAMKDAYINIIKRGVGSKITNAMGV